MTHLTSAGTIYTRAAISRMLGRKPDTRQADAGRARKG